MFSVWLGWFPFGFSVPIGVSAADVTLADALHHLALPALTLSVVGVANIALHTREKTIDVLESDYVRFARTRGLIAPGAPCATTGCATSRCPRSRCNSRPSREIFGGSVLVEQVFSYPGLGQAAVTAGLGGDVALLAGIALFSAAFVFGGNLHSQRAVRRGGSSHAQGGEGSCGAERKPARPPASRWLRPRCSTLLARLGGGTGS